MAEQGHVEAQFKLGDAYYSGKGTRKNLELAFFWYETEAAKQRYARGQFYLGRMFEQGLGVERNLAQASGWYSKAAALGHVQARKQLAKVKSEHGKTDEKKEKVKQEVAGQAQ